MFKSTSIDSSYFMGPDYGMDSILWDYSLLWWGDYSKYLLGRYVLTSATSIRDLQLGHVSVGDPYTPATGHNPVIQTSQKVTLSMRAPVPQLPQIAPAICQLPPFPQGQPATLYQQVMQLPIRTSGSRVTFDSSATKPAPTGSQGTNAHGRQLSRG